MGLLGIRDRKRITILFDLNKIVCYMGVYKGKDRLGRVNRIYHNAWKEVLDIRCTLNV